MFGHSRLISKKLIHWFEKNQRDLPFRKTCDPYSVWISEIMLQQTRVDTVIGYYSRFLKKFPNVFRLSKAKPDQVLKAWEGLGYYSRARNIHQAAKDIVSRHGGKFPEEYDKIIALPGIGKYTVGAILSIAFGKRYPAVDGNVLRVISRIFRIKESVDSPIVKKRVEEIVLQLMPKDKTSQFTQGLMELGAIICVPENPRCQECPIWQYCEAYKKGVQNHLPVKGEKAKPKIIYRYVAVIRDSEEKKVLMHKRASNGVLAGLWEFPGVEAKTKREFLSKFTKAYQLKIKDIKYWMDVEHVFTHLRWKMKVYKCLLFPETKSLLKTLKWVNQKEMNRLTIPTAFQKIKQIMIGKAG
jgi:A/G-specific adenine glycosylase